MKPGEEQQAKPIMAAVWLALFSSVLCRSILDWLITLGSPRVSWYKEPYNKNMVARWAAAALALPYREDVAHRYAVPRCVRQHPTTTYPRLHVGVVEGAAISS